MKRKSNKYAIVMLLIFHVAFGSYGQAGQKQVIPADTMRVKTLLKEANNQANVDSAVAKTLVREALRLSQALHQKRWELECYHYLGSICMAFSDTQAAENHFKQALKIAQSIGEENQILVLEAAIGTNFVNKGNMKQASELLSKVATQTRQELKKQQKPNINLLKAAYISVSNLGFIHGTNATMHEPNVDMQEYEQAYRYFKEAAKYAELDDRLKPNLSGLYVNMGAYFADAKKNDDSAHYYFDKSIAFAQALGQEYSLVEPYYSKAYLYIGKRDYKTAEIWLMKALPISKKYKDPNYLVSIPVLLSEIYIATKRFAEAKKWLLPALDLAKQSQIPYKEQEVLPFLYEIYKNEGNHALALQYFERNEVLKDSLYSIEKTEALRELSVKYETEKKTTTIKTLESQKMLRNYIILAMLFAFVGIIYAIYNRRKAYRIEKKLLEQITTNKQQQIEKKQIEIDAKNRELSLHSLYLEQRKNILQEVKKQLINKQPEMLDKNALLREIDATMQLETEWQNFKIHFEEIHPQFFEKLLEHTPNLTELELRHCAYVKLGFSPKQVAQILSIETDSVSIARVRLKKKLKLQEDETLQAFLKNC